MPIEAVDAQVASLISDAQLSYQREALNSDADAQIRRQLEQKAEIKKEALKTSDEHEVFQRQEQVQRSMQQILGGAAGPDAQNALGAWQKNTELQQKLTEAQKNLFRQAMVENPKKGAQTADAANRLSQSPQFKNAVTTSQQAGTIHAALVDNPGTEKLISEVLSQRFMQSAKADAKTKNDFLRFALARGADGKMDAIKKAGDMLGSLAGKGVNAGGQRAAMSMASRKPGDSAAMSNVDVFVQQPQVGKLPSFARGKSTELLAKANGAEDVKEGFEKLANSQTFKAQTAGNKGRFFSTIGSGKPSEFRAITDKMLAALQSSSFPTREGQVSKFLTKVAGQAAKGAANVDTDGAIKAAKLSALPRAPSLQSTEGLSDDDVIKVRSQNRAKVIQFYTQLSRVYDQAEKKLGGAKYFEDVNSLQTLRKPEEIDTANLSPEDKALVQTKSAEMGSKLDGLQKLQRQKARELRTKRMPAAKRRAMQNERRAVGRKPKYFNPNTSSPIGRQTASAAYAKAASGNLALQHDPQYQEKLAATPFRGALAERSLGGRGGTMDIQRQVATALQQAQRSGLTAENAGDVARAIAETVAKSVAESVSRTVAAQVAQQLIGAQGRRATALADDTTTQTTQVMPRPLADEGSRGGAQGAVRFGVGSVGGAALGGAASGNTAGSTSRQQGKVDGWGIPRTFERDLGGADRPATKPPITESIMADNALAANLTTSGEPQTEPYTGKQLVRAGANVRSMDTLMPQTWKTMSKPETALLKNLGWNQQTWDTKDTPAAKWPITMVTAYVNLSPLQRESVRKLGMTARDWDKRVQAFTGGKNA